MTRREPAVSATPPRRFIYEPEPLLDGTNEWGVFQYDVDDPGYAAVVNKGTEAECRKKADEVSQ